MQSLKASGRTARSFNWGGGLESIPVRLLVCILSAGCLAEAATILGDVNGISPASHPPYTVSLNPSPTTHVSSGVLNGPAPPIFLDTPSDPISWLMRLQTLNPNWGISLGDDAPGTFNVLQYQSFAKNTLGGADFSVLYDDAAPAPRTDYSWLQIGYPQSWGTYGSSDFVDSTYSNFPMYGNDTPISLPGLMVPGSFYGPAMWLKAPYAGTKLQNPPATGTMPAGDMLFVDEPYCSYTCTDVTGSASIAFDLFLISYTWNGLGSNSAGGTIVIQIGRASCRERV